MPDAIDPYKILQVDPEAEDEVIQAAYRRLARNTTPTLQQGPSAPARMAAINAAWELIGDPAKRLIYDRCAARRQRAHRRRHASVAVSWRMSGAADAAGSGSRAERPPHRATTARVARPAGRQVRHRPISSRVTGHPAGRPTGVVSTNRCARHEGHAGPPPGRPSGRVLNFGRYAGWSLGEIARQDLEYIEWLDRMPIGRPYRDDIDGILRSAGRRTLGRRATPTTDGVCTGVDRAAPPLEVDGRPRRGVTSPPPSDGRFIGSDTVRSMRRPMVVPWTISVNRTTPNVISCSSVRCGMWPAAPAPWRPPRHLAARPRTGREPARRGGFARCPPARTTATRPRAGRRRRPPDPRGYRRSPTDRPKRVIKPAGGMARPTSRNTTAVSR